MYFRPDKRSVYFAFTEKEQEAQDKIMKAKLMEPADPILKFTADETKTLADTKAGLDKAANEFATKYVMKKEYGDAEWNEWVQNSGKLGAKKIVDAYNSAQKRFNENK
jgi:putative aldouronate transport system substrate-binding protein